jgi:hypothetical protein
VSWRTRLAAVPVWVWLLGVFALSVAFRFVLAHRHPAPWIYDDELIYAALAKSFAASGHFAVRGVSGLQGYGPLYPLTIAPAYRAFTDLAHAYTVAKGINSVVMSAAVFPAYLIARRFLGAWLALFAAVLAVAIPSLEYTSTIMTENLFYPLFLLCAWAMIRALERPTTWSQLLGVALIVPAFLTRAQAVALVPALVTAILVLVVAEAGRARKLRDLRGFGRRLRVFAPTWLALGAGVVLVLGVEIARGRSLSQFLGAYQGLAGSNYSIGAIAKWFGYQLAELDVYVGVLPLAAFLVLAMEAFRRGRGRALTAFAAVSLSLVFWLMLVVAAFAAHLEQQNGVGRIEERNLFYLAPLLLVALLAWAAGQVPRRWPVLGAAAVVAGVLPVVIPYTRFVNLGALSDTFAFIALWRLVFTGVLALGTLKLFVTACALGAAAFFLVLPRRLALLAPLVVLGYFYVLGRPLEHQIRDTSSGVLASAITVRREWIDEHVGPSAHVTAVETTQSSPRIIPEDEFFNRSVRAAYDVGAAPPGGTHLPAGTATIDERTGRFRDSAGKAIRTPYALADSLLPLRGQPVASDPGVGAVVYRIHGPLALTEQVSGLYPDEFTGPVLSYTRFECTGGRLVLTLAAQPGLVKGPQRVVAAAATRTVARASVPAGGTEKTLSVPLHPLSGRCALRLTITPTAVPAQVLGTPDTRELGLRVVNRRYIPPRIPAR